MVNKIEIKKQQTNLQIIYLNLVPNGQEVSFVKFHQLTSHQTYLSFCSSFLADSSPFHLWHYVQNEYSDYIKEKINLPCSILVHFVTV